MVFLVSFGLKNFAHAEIVEKLPHRDHGANGEEGAETPDPPETTIADVFPPFQLDAGVLITGIHYRFHSTQDLVDVMAGGLKQYTRPAIDFALSDSNLLPGNTTDILAITNGYESPYNSQYFSWCLGTKEERIGQNGLVAGGTRVPLDDNGPDCYDDVQRNPTKSNDSDANKDGMGDLWESRYFTTTNVNPNSDPDKDGFLLDAKNGISGPNGIIRVAPNSYIVVNNKKLPYETCDGQYPNAEEWVWGTNPLDPDSDDDGYPDEADICGRGQIKFSYTVPAGSRQGDSEFLETISVGYSTSRSGNGSKKFAKIANTGKTLFVGNGESLDGELEYRVINDTQQDGDTKENVNTLPEDIFVGDEVEFHAAIDGSQDDESNLHYQWTFELLDGGVSSDKEPNKILDTVGPIPQQYGIADSRIGQTGFGLNPYRLKINQADPTKLGTGFHIMPKTGNKVRVIVAAIEPATGKKAEIQQEFQIATSITLAFSPELPVQPLYPQAEITSAPSYTVTAIAPGLPTNAFLYEWYIDEEKQPNARIGGDSLTFKATKQLGNYKIRVVLTRVSDESVFAETEVLAPVSPLRVSITNCTQYTEGGKYIGVGDGVSLDATIVAQGNYPGELTYQWFINGNPLTDPSSTPVNHIKFVPSDAGSYTAEYKVESIVPTQATDAPYVPLLISDSCRISVGAQQGVALTDRFSHLIASVAFSLPNVARGLLTFAGIIFVVFVIILLVRKQYKNKS